MWAIPSSSSNDATHQPRETLAGRRRATPATTSNATIAVPIESGGKVVLHKGAEVLGKVTEAVPQGNRGRAYTGEKEIVLPAESTLSFKLAEPLTIKM